MIVRFSPAARTIASPVADDPTNPTASMPGWVTSASPTAPSPGRIDTSPSGTPASVEQFARFAGTRAACGPGGLHTIALPVARAGARNSAMIISGKFHGVIAGPDPDRLAVREDALVTLDARDGRAVEALGVLGRHCEQLGRVGHVAARFGFERFALFDRREPGQLVGVLLDECGDAMAQRRPLVRRRVPVLGERVLRGCDRGVDVGGATATGTSASFAPVTGETTNSVRSPVPS